MQRVGGPVVIAVGVVLVLAVVGGLLFLLPIGLGDRLAASQDLQFLTSETPTAAHPDGLLISAAPNLLTTEFGVKLSSVTRADFHSGKAGPEWVKPRERLPTYLNLIESAFGIEAQGTTPAELSISVPVPPEAESTELLDLYGWDGEAWYFIPSRIEGDQAVGTVQVLPQAIAIMQTAPVVPMTATVLQLGESLGEIGSAINVVSPTGLVLQADGSLTGEITGGFAFGQGYGVMPIISNSASAEGAAALNAMLSDPSARQTQIGSLVDLAVNGGYNGVVVDYRGLDPARGPAFTLFVETLAAALQNKSLIMVIPTPVSTENGFNTAGYDLRSLGAAADAIEIDLGDDPTTVGVGTARDTLAWVVGEVNRYKVRILTSSLSVDTANGASTRITASQALALLGSAVVQSDVTALAPGSEITVALDGKAGSLTYDELAFTPNFTYTDEAGVTHTVHYATPGMLAQQLALAQALNLGGVTVRDLFNADNTPGMLDAVVQYKINAAAAATASDAAVVWTVSNAEGVVAQGSTALEESFTWTVPAAGEYSVAAALQYGSSAPLSALTIIIAEQEVEAEEPTPAATATPAPALPTATPCTDCPTPTPIPPTATPAPTTPPITAAGSWGAFELGGQVVHGGIAPSNEMKTAGMAWVKLQAHYPNDASADINNAHALGFKILLSVVGDRTRAHDPTHQAEFAAYLGTLASAGADAIEVWNEMNLDREWPNGQISPQSYVSMLQQAYAAIKGANPNTLVISGAPAPTGYYGGCFPHGCDDRPYVEGLAAAGAANYLDCLGIHYNEGIVPPSAFGGGADPRDDHYTRYFYGMIETYSAAFGGARQMCFTELGYLSGEEWGYLPAGFLWKPPYNNTVAEQAQYLAEAASLAKADGRIRMITVFNVDFTHWGDDPQAGYAIIRPNGQCPACSSLGAVMP